MIDWHRRRHPEDVPTPVAVAVADFCRRARAPASPALVRDALSLLSDADDRRVRALADSEPLASPLGPFAVVDVVSGVDQALAAQREQTGYYTLVKELAATRALERPTPRASTPAPPTPRREPARAEPRTRRRKAPSLAERIAPRKRQAGTPRPPPPSPPPPGSSFLPKRQLPAPRGRFTRVDSTRTPVDALLKTTAHDEVEAIAAQAPTRAALRRLLEPGYCGRQGAALSTADVVAVLSRHKLLRAMAKKEREAVLGALAEAKGSLGGASRALDMSRTELEQLIEQLQVEREVRELRDRSIREALATRALAWRLELVGRPRYLADLGIERRFAEALARDLTALFDALEPVAGVAPAELAARQHGLSRDLLHRAVEKLGLSQRLRE